MIRYSRQTQCENCRNFERRKASKKSISCKTTQCLLFSKGFQDASYESEKAKSIKIRNSTNSFIYIYLILIEDIYSVFNFKINFILKSAEITYFIYLLFIYNKNLPLEVIFLQLHICIYKSMFFCTCLFPEENTGHLPIPLLFLFVPLVYATRVAFLSLTALVLISYVLSKLAFEWLINILCFCMHLIKKIIYHAEFVW